ncbi:putative cytoplasmic protein [Salmonella enterica subsp. enterica serovar Give]|nr:putative cytoplasmic protein [Salmonella enterica subsp. enterica serovar Give]
MNIQASYRTFICLVEGASLCVLAIRPGVSGWMRRTLHQLVYCTVGPSSLALGSAQNPQGLRYRVVLERHLPEIAAEK